MSRIVAGTAGGRRIEVPRGRTTRPTADRVREAMFASLLSELGTFAGLRVLDLYAGSGALGLEALSRGADAALLVESDRRAAATIRHNIATLRLPGAELVVDRVERLLARSAAGAGHDLLFADPPYAVTATEVAAVLAAARGNGWLAAGAVAVVERPSRDGAPPWPDGFVSTRVRRYGEATLWYGHAV